jgi:hypothetical protein
MGRTWAFLARHTPHRGLELLPLRHGRTSRRVRVPLAALLKRDPSLCAVQDLRPGWTAHRQSPQHDWERNRIPTGPTHFLRFEAVQVEQGDGMRCEAFVNCWIRDRASKIGVRRIAETQIMKAGWRPTVLEEQSIIERHRLRAAGRRYFDQAQIDGVVLVIYRYPAGRF